MAAGRWADGGRGGATAGVGPLRVLAGLDPDDLRRAALQGEVLHGMPPRDEAEWELAREMFTPDAVRMLEGWEREREARRRVPPSWYAPVEPSYRVGEP